MPRMLSLEINTVCNAKCVMCPQSTLARRGRTMKFTDVMDVVQQAVLLGVKRIQPHLYGESHLHPDYIKILTEIKERWPTIILTDTTNGSALTKPKIADAMAELLDSLTVSLDAADAATIEEIRPGLDGAAVIAGARSFLSREKRPKVTVNTVVMDEYPDQVKKIQHLFRNISTPWSHGICQKSDLHGFNECKVGLRDMTRACSRPFHIVTVNVDGDVILCCRDQNSEVSFGSAIRPGGYALDMAWKNVDVARELHADRRSGVVDLCSRCTYSGYMRQVEIKSWFLGDGVCSG